MSLQIKSLKLKEIYKKSSNNKYKWEGSIFMEAIVYTSNTGTTKEYAELLGSKLSLPVYSLNEAKTNLKADSEIIYLGWIMASSIKGYKKI